jgi:hypothetical protein
LIILISVLLSNTNFLPTVTNFPLMADDEGQALLSNGTEINWQEEVESLLASLALATKE